MFKINRNFLLIILLYFLGFTHFLGGPYWLAKFFFIVFIIGTLIFSIFVTGLSFFVGRFINKRIKIFSNINKSSNDQKNGPIKVDAKIVE